MTAPRAFIIIGGGTDATWSGYLEHTDAGRGALATFESRGDALSYLNREFCDGHESIIVEVAMLSTQKYKVGYGFQESTQILAHTLEPEGVNDFFSALDQSGGDGW